MNAAIAVEWLKLRRSRVVATATVLVAVGAPALAALFAGVARRPGDSTLALKVRPMLLGAGWAAYLNLLEQILAVGLLLGVGVVVAWCFGREFVDRTATSLYALPVSRATVAAAKFAVLLGWSAGLSLLVTAVAVAVGPLTGLAAPGLADLGGILKLLAVSLLTALLAQPVALFASAGRGLLPAIGALLLVVIAAQVCAVTSVGAWFPYTVPGLWATAGAATIGAPNAVQFLLVPALAAAGVAATAWWWRRAQAA